MRLDKFLQIARFFKRRTVAQEVLREGLVKVNDRTAKHSTQVKPGDVVVITLGSQVIKFEVVAVSEHVMLKDVPSLYRMLTE